MNRISFEKKAAKKYMLKTIKSDCACLVDITPNNVAMVEAMIQNDSAYLNAANSQLGTDKNGNVGSTAYCMCQLKNYINNKETDKKLYKKIISDAVIAVDRDNSTHLNADGIGRKQITKRIFKLSPEQLIHYLKAPKETNYKLFKIISKKTTNTSKPRENKSFASKFCHYACFYLFEGEKEQDNYSIYDSVLKNVLPTYAEYYSININKNDLEDYITYSDIIERILKKTGNKISKNGFDHLLWYYHKGRI